VGLLKSKLLAGYTNKGVDQFVEMANALQALMVRRFVTFDFLVRGHMH